MSQEITRRSVLKALAAVAAALPLASQGEQTVDNSEAAGREQIEKEEAAFDPVVHSSGTKLERFLRSRGIKPTHLAREAGYTRRHLLRLRLARIEPTRRCIVRLTEAARRIAREKVSPCHLFDLTAADERWVTRCLTARERVRRSREKEDSDEN